MSLATGARVGPYELLALIGAGGMGEVYRARDPRIGREVALKVLASACAADPDRLRRFEQEVQAAGALNHPNILSIYDVGRQDGAPFIVSELLEGETLRARMHGAALPVRKAVDYALEIVRGLAAAHDKGIVHRDLKPENVFITHDGRVKILDFGLAKLTQQEAAGRGTDAATVAVNTEPGIVLGTIGYMSPEQVRGQAADARSDIFSFGAVLYEMLTGRRAFRGDTSADTMTAILTLDPPPLAGVSPNVPAALERIVQHCLEKSPAERFQSARDIAFDLEALTGTSVSSGAVAAAKPSPRPAVRRAVLALAAAAVIALSTFLGTKLRAPTASAPVYHQLTFRRGGILTARFAPDGQTIIYGAAWEGRPAELFSTRPEGPESRPLGLAEADVLAVSPAAEMAIALHRNFLDWWQGRGTLARVPLAGGAPREILEDVQAADWSPDGSQLAAIRKVGDRCRIEFPIGEVLYETTGGISHLRVSPKGDLVAFIDHPMPPDDAGLVAVVDRAGHKRTLTGRYNGAQGLAWAPSGAEIWYTAAERVNSELRAVTVSDPTRTRTVAVIPGRLLLHDIFRDGRVLLMRQTWRIGVAGIFPGDTRERDLSWLDVSLGTDMSDDGRFLLMSEEGEGGGPGYTVYLRKTDGAPAIRLGDGMSFGLSPDRKWAVSLLRGSPMQLVLLPTGAGEVRPVPTPGVEPGAFVNWFPDGKRILFNGQEPGRAQRLYIGDLAGGKPRPIGPESCTPFGGHLISPDGRRLAAVDIAGKTWLYPIDGGERKAVTGVGPQENPIGWSADARWMYLLGPTAVPQKIDRLEILTGRREAWREIVPADPAGFIPGKLVYVTPDGKYYCYTYTRTLDDLYLVEGLK